MKNKHPKMKNGDAQIRHTMHWGTTLLSHPTLHNIARKSSVTQTRHAFLVYFAGREQKGKKKKVVSMLCGRVCPKEPVQHRVRTNTSLDGPQR